jgi:hypothetical protein
MKDKIIILKNHLKQRNIKIIKHNFLIKLKFKIGILNFKRCKERVFIYNSNIK